MSKKIAKTGAASSKIKEFFRKFIVSFKRNPQMIPLIVLTVAFVIFSFNLTNLSDATAKLYGPHMGLCQFCMMLFTILSMVCMLNSFPRRKPANLPMIVIMFGMFALMLTCAIFFEINVSRKVVELEIDLAKAEYATKSTIALYIYMALVVITAILVVLLPVYSKWLKKINTSVVIEDNGNMGEIEISD